MKRGRRVLSYLLVALCGAVAGVWMLAPRVGLDWAEAERQAESRRAGVPDVAALDGWLATRESEVNALRDGAQKRVVWAGPAGQVTPLAVVYVHGFSAAAQEIQPVPQRVAQALGANLHFTRLTGHGRDGAAMAEATPEAWMADYAEALAVGSALGRRVLVITTSTGGTLAALAATRGAWPDPAGIVFVSPNFRVQAAMAPVLEWPGARWWLPLLAGRERSFVPTNDLHAQHWTTRYPSSAVFSMAGVVRAARAAPMSAARVPALFLTSPDDQVVDPAATANVATRWGGPVTQVSYRMGPGDDPNAHVIAGDILSPEQTDRAVSDILAWVAGWAPATQ